MENSLVGYTGFVGSNLCESMKFDGLYDSKNVKEAYGTKPHILVYSGVPAQKFLANQYPDKDMEIIKGAIDNIKKINPHKVILISTIDVYNKPHNVDEDSEIDIGQLQPYGKNRYYLEKWVKENYEDVLIVHLPALYGKNLKKNFIYDMIHIIPSMINKQKFQEITKEDNYIKKYYQCTDDGYYRFQDNINKEEKNKLKEYFLKINFSALNFTDSRATYQFYNLSNLWNHIQIAIHNDIRVLNLAVEPIRADELYKYVEDKEFKNEILEKIPMYNFKTKYAELFGGEKEYILTKKFILEDIRNYIIKGKKNDE